MWTISRFARIIFFSVEFSCEADSACLVSEVFLSACFVAFTILALAVFVVDLAAFAVSFVLVCFALLFLAVVEFFLLGDLDAFGD